MADALDQIGVPYCRGGVMAKNAGCRHSAAIWRQVIDGWIEHSEPADLLNVDIFFDGVAVHGDAPLADGIFDYAVEQARREPRFAMVLASATRGWRPPLTVFGNLRQDEHSRIDLKKGGLLPIFTGARALAIRNDIRGRRCFVRRGRGHHRRPPCSAPCSSSS
jgi:DNA polymerase-3 subunit epsilon/CBS domain-containing protein